MMTTQRYDAVAIALHWGIAALIAAAFILGLTVDDFPKAYEAAVVNAHSIIGLAVVTLSLARVGWRFAHRPPPLPRASGPVLETMSKVVHVLLYVLMIVVPLIGIPTLLYRGRGIDFGVFQMPPLAPRTPEIFRPLTELHELAAYALVLLAVGHISAALYHQFVLRDDLVRRMTLRPMAGGS
jgi:cytochrome b561